MRAQRRAAGRVSACVLAAPRGSCFRFKSERQGLRAPLESDGGRGGGLAAAATEGQAGGGQAGAGVPGFEIRI